MVLKDVTLIALTSRNIEGHKKALEYSCRGIQFGDVKLITHLENNSIDEWNYNIVFNLGDYVDTDYALLIHDDGFVVNPEMWRDEWREYDYIGAPWPIPYDNYSFRDNKGEVRRVGNSVGLRSKRLLELPKQLGMEWRAYHGNTNEDGYICVNNVHIFEEHGCKIAPLDVAKHFSHETMIPEVLGIKPFMFHRYEGTNSNFPRFK